MRRDTSRTIRAMSGFTLMELLVVVAVAVIVAAIAAPNVAHIARNTEVSRLDNYAKEIYVAVADQFVGMEASSEYVAFNQLVREAVSRNLGNMDAVPGDAPNSEWRNYYYLTSYDAGSGGPEGAADIAMQAVVDRVAVLKDLVHGGRYIIEVNPRSDGTDVYSVFYSEDARFTYDDVLKLDTRSIDERRGAIEGSPLGYYCGIAAEGSETPDQFNPRATFVNGEELFLNVFCRCGIGLVGTQYGLSVNITITDGTTTDSFTLSGGQDFQLDEHGNIDFDIVVDSLREGMHFADFEPSLKPGANLNATVEVTYLDPDGSTITTPAGMRGQATANSLYANNFDGLVEVANVRHLANLALVPSDVFAVRQTADIDFDASTWGTVDRTRLSLATRLHNENTYRTAYVNPLDPRTSEYFPGFAPLSPAAGATWEFDGRGNTLSNFYFKGEGASGLFATVQPGQSVSNVTLVDTTVEGPGPAGTLAGRVLGRVANCGAHLGIYSDVDAHKQSLFLVRSTGEGAAGGLVGEATGDQAVLEGCYAAVDVVGTESSAVGGLVGRFAGLAVSTSYASGVVDAGGAAGGLMGVLSSGAVQGCYSTSDVNSGSPAGGFVGSAERGFIMDCVSYGQVSALPGGAFVGAQGGAEFQECRCLVQTGYNMGLDGQPEGVSSQDLGSLSAARLGPDHSHPYRARLLGTSFPFAPVLDDHWGNWPDPVPVRPTLLYYEHYADGSYGYYGTGYDLTEDISINTLDDTLVVSDDGYALLVPQKLTGFDYRVNNGESFRANVGDAPATGTFVELPTRADSAQYAAEGAVDEGDPSYYLYYRKDEATIPLQDFHVYQLPFDLQMPGRVASSFYDLLEIEIAEADGISSNSYSFYYNPDFARMATSPNAQGRTDAPADPARLPIRTARQPNRLGYQPLYWGATVALERDVDFGYYTKDYLGNAIDLSSTSGPYANQPIGLIGQPFTGIFDGAEFAVIDFNINAPGQVAAGMFGCVSGTVRNVHVAASKINAATVMRTGDVPGSFAPSLGVLVGLVDGGTVEGCSASGYRVSFESPTAVNAVAVGGLVGLNQGTVARSTAANITVVNDAASASGATLGTGGLVGGNAGTVISCYAVENVLLCHTGTSGSGRTLVLGGLAGVAFEGDRKVEGCYAWAYKGETACAEGDAVRLFALTDPANTQLVDCCYLDVAEPFEDGEAAKLVSPTELQNATIGSMSGGAVPRATYGETMSGHVVQHSDNYPYPVVCRDPYGDMAHYGFDWWF